MDRAGQVLHDLAMLVYKFIRHDDVTGMGPSNQRRRSQGDAQVSEQYEAARIGTERRPQSLKVMFECSRQAVYLGRRGPVSEAVPINSCDSAPSPQPRRIAKSHQQEGAVKVRLPLDHRETLGLRN